MRPTITQPTASSPATSPFDYQSLALALYQEYIELDLFHRASPHSLAKNSRSSAWAAGDRYLLQFMAEQEIGHATVITNMLGAEAPWQGELTPPQPPRVHDFNQKLLIYSPRKA
ncbi:protein rds1 [Colletotrichum orchidophilum]|uniref:Protein rds1 n=1 Tax=Colletotrichum orchidophilum TaxID=1209926 RepID=A0A1G4BEH1_9PEZI|nr:protein rds1 [Colletotrichum orchidophilum]OHE99879.1 protein rds1 [Colletotrichum orchidophilum]